LVHVPTNLEIVLYVSKSRDYTRLGVLYVSKSRDYTRLGVDSLGALS